MQSTHHQNPQECPLELQLPWQSGFHTDLESSPLCEDGETFLSPRLFPLNLIHHHYPFCLIFAGSPQLLVLLLRVVPSQHRSERVELVLNSLRRNKKRQSMNISQFSRGKANCEGLPGKLTETTINNRSCKRPYFLLLPSPIMMRKA